MHRITFFSIKGGSGRSLSLANIAFYLARKNKRVGCIDFDIMAPGLQSIFNIPDDVSNKKNSVIDLLLNIGNVELLLNSFIDCSEYHKEVKKGNLWLIQAKPEKKDKYRDLSKSDSFKVSTMALFNKFYLKPFIDIKELDYLLIDSRSGLAEESLCGLSLAEKFIVLFTRLDKQSLSVTMHFINLLFEYKYRLQPLIVLTNVPTGPVEIEINDQKYHVNDTGYNIIREFSKNLNKLNLPISCLIPFDEELIIEHKLLNIEDDESSPSNKGMLKLANIIENL